MKYILSAIFSCFLLLGCILSHKPESKDGFVHLDLSTSRPQVLMKTAGGGDTIFRLDTVIITISSPGLPDSIDKIVTDARSDTGGSLLSTRSYTLKSLRTYKFKIVTIDTTLNPIRRDTIHIDSITDVYVKPEFVTSISKTISAVYSILNVRIKSDSASFVSNNVRKLRFKIDGVVADSVSINTKTFNQILTFKYLTPNVNHTVLLQAFDNVANNRGYEKTFTINIPPNRDTTIVDSVFVRSSTAQSGSTSTTIKLDASASSTTDFYKGMSVTIISGPGAGQTRSGKGYSGTTKVFTIYPAWVTTPTNTSSFVIFHKNLLTICGVSGFPSCTP